MPAATDKYRPNISIELLSHKNIGGYTLSRINPGVDSIIASLVAEQPDFDDPDGLKKQIEIKVFEFENDVASILNNER